MVVSKLFSIYNYGSWRLIIFFWFVSRYKNIKKLQKISRDPIRTHSIKKKVNKY